MRAFKEIIMFTSWICKVVKNDLVQLPVKFKAELALFRLDPATHLFPPTKVYFSAVANFVSTVYYTTQFQDNLSSPYSTVCS